MKVAFILYNSQLELIPRKLWGHPSIKKWSKFRKKHPSRMLLDQTLYFSAAKNLRDYKNRGRVDILHRALLLILDSELNMRGDLVGVLIHTLHNRIFYVAPKTRIPRHYFRFLGLMEKLLVERKISVPETSERLMFELSSLEEGTKLLGINKIIGFSRQGEEIPLESIMRDLLPKLKSSTLGIIIGAYSYGSLRNKIGTIAEKVISLGNVSLSTQIVVCKVLATIERIARNMGNNET